MRPKKKRVVLEWLNNFEELEKFYFKFIKDHDKDPDKIKMTEYYRTAKRYLKIYGNSI